MTSDVPGAGVRQATAADAPTVGRLLHDFNTEFDTPTPSAQDFAARFGELLGRGDVLVLLADRGDEAVGMACLTLRPTPYGQGPLAELEELYVVPARARHRQCPHHRGPGAGAGARRHRDAHQRR